VDAVEFAKLLPVEKESTWADWGFGANDKGIFDPTAMWVDEERGKVVISACLTTREWGRMDAGSTCNGVYEMTSSLLPKEWGGSFDADEHMERGH
jgi:hypothetical protein